MNEKTHEFSKERSAKKEEKNTKKEKKGDDRPEGEPENRGNVIYDATVCPQDITYPTDHHLLSKAREITEEIIEILHHKKMEGKKPRTYRENARKAYLKVAQNKNPSNKTIRKGVKSQLQYVRRNFKTIEKQLNGFEDFLLDHKLQRSTGSSRRFTNNSLGCLKAEAIR